MPICKVNERQFSWSTSVSDDYPLLAKPYPSPVMCEVVRITGEEGFDVVLRVDRQSLAGAPLIVFGPIQVMGTGFPNTDRPVPPGSRIRLRPKVSCVEAIEIDSSQIERIVSWCASANFRAVPCDRHGLPAQSREEVDARPV